MKCHNRTTSLQRRSESQSKIWASLLLSIIILAARIFCFRKYFHFGTFAVQFWTEKTENRAKMWQRNDIGPDEHRIRLNNLSEFGVKNDNLCSPIFFCSKIFNILGDTSDFWSRVQLKCQLSDQSGHDLADLVSFWQNAVLEHCFDFLLYLIAFRTVPNDLDRFRSRLLRSSSI